MPADINDIRKTLGLPTTERSSEWSRDATRRDVAHGAGAGRLWRNFSVPYAVHHVGRRVIAPMDLHAQLISAHVVAIRDALASPSKLDHAFIESLPAFLADRSAYLVTRNVRVKVVPRFEDSVLTSSFNCSRRRRRVCFPCSLARYGIEATAIVGNRQPSVAVTHRGEGDFYRSGRCTL